MPVSETICEETGRLVEEFGNDIFKRRGWEPLPPGTKHYWAMSISRVDQTTHEILHITEVWPHSEREEGLVSLLTNLFEKVTWRMAARARKWAKLNRRQKG